MEAEYHSLKQKHGASITDLVRIGRREGSLRYIFEDADFFHIQNSILTKTLLIHLSLISRMRI